MTNERTGDPLTKVAKHEIGHTLGLGHDDEPQEVMSDDHRDRVPNYETRIRIFNNYRGAVRYVKSASDSMETSSSHYERRDYRNASREYSAAVEDLRYSEGYFNKAGSLASRISMQDVSRKCDTAAGEARNMRFAASRYSDSADAYIRNNRNRAERLRQDGQRYYSESNLNSVASSRDIYHRVRYLQN
jgi:hypothetical protein